MNNANGQLELFYEIYDFYARYAAVLDDGPLERWPSFFAEECMYQVLPRDNYERNLPVAIIRCESRAMVEDRVVAIQETMMYEPRYMRHQTSDIRIVDGNGPEYHVEAHFSIIEVLPDELPRVSMAGRYVDRLNRNASGQLQFTQKLCVFDSILIPNSVVYPA